MDGPLGWLHRGTLVCVTGIDGAGKTTASRRTVAALRGRGVDATYVYGKHRPVLLYPLLVAARLFFLRDVDYFEEYDEHSETKRQATESHGILGRVYLGVLYLDFALQALVKILPPLVRGRTVVCDRYVYDTVVVDVATDFNYTETDVIDRIRRLLRVLPTPDAVVFLDVPEEVSLRRKDDVPDVAFLRERRRLFEAVASSFPVAPVDGTRAPSDVAAAVLYACVPHVPGLDGGTESGNRPE